MTNTRLLALGGLLGASIMFTGDMLFYGGWGSGAELMATLAVRVSARTPDQLMLGGLLAIPAGLGLLCGVLHVHRRSNLAVSLPLLAVVIAAVTTHAVWGAFAVTLATGPSVAQVVVWRYLDLCFLIATVLAVPSTLSLLGFTALGRTTWPRWMTLANPGLIYVLLLGARWMPAPLGAPLLGGGFNLAFAAFFALSFTTSPRQT